MTPDRARLAEHAFQEALSLPAQQRGSFLLRRLPGDEPLQRTVRELLDAHEESLAGGEDLLENIARRWRGLEEVTPSEPESPEATSGRYRVLEVLGEGGMGIVFLAEQTTPVRRRVALKIVKLGVDDRNDLARFAAERQILALMNHPNIAQVYEAGTSSDGRLYFAMEFVRGRQLTEYCDAARLTVRERITLFIEICHAVQHAHQNGVIHRDIKPSNILVQTDGSTATPKLIDFGVAKSAYRRFGEHSVHTLKGVLIGSLEYMSPEQAAADEPEIDTRTDIYSLGVVLHELLTGVRPAVAGSDAARSRLDLEHLAGHREFLPASRRVAALGADAAEFARRRGVDPAALGRQLTGDLDWITAKALERDRMRRYSSASELAGDLERHLRHESVRAGPPGARYRIAKFARRHRGVLVAAGVTLISLVAGLLASTRLYLDNLAARRQLEEQRAHIQLSSNAYLLEHFVARAERLVPGLPEQIPELEAWIAQVEASLLPLLPPYRRRLAELQNPHAAPAGAGPRSGFDDQDRLDAEVLRDLVPALERFTAPSGTLADVRHRLAFARRVRLESIDSKRREWARALASIANPAECPAYAGLRLEPQLGLVPLGRDATSGLWEFAHLGSGVPAARAPDGTLRMTDSTGIVLVLLPAGTFFMGAANSRRALPPGAGNFDPLARANESPVRAVSLDAFFISKFEVTQAQWQRVMHGNPSECAPGTRLPGMDYVHTLLHPVERVNHRQVERAVARLGLTLPTEAQWEYAARAGTMTPAYWGAPRDMRGFVNGADLASLRAQRRDWEYAPWDDGYAKSAPVGTYRPNRFGLHDVQGNVGEWCRDEYSPDAYSAPIRNGEGERAVPAGDDYKVFISRGAAWDHQPMHARISWRIDLPAFSEERLGLRPARRIESSR